MGTNTDLYEQDFFQWTQTTATLIRKGEWSTIDLQCLAEELEGLGKRDLRELEERLDTLLYNLLKWWAQPKERCGRWASAISYQRYEMALILRDSPSLQPQFNTALEKNYPHVRQQILEDTGLFNLPEICPFTPTQVLTEDFWPQDPILSKSKPDNPV